MLTRNDLAAYIADNYGTCDRAADCYWGTDLLGHYNGCLRVGWSGVECPHWHPVEATTWDELRTNGQ